MQNASIPAAPEVLTHSSINSKSQISFKYHLEAFPVVQWLRIHTSTSGAQVRSPVREVRSHVLCCAAKGKKKERLCLHVCVVLLGCLTLCNPMDSPPGSSVHGIIPTRILEWVAVSYSRGSSQPRDNSCLLHLLDRQAEYYLKQTWVRLEVQFLWRQNVPPAVNQISCVLPKYSGGTSIG